MYNDCGFEIHASFRRLDILAAQTFNETPLQMHLMYYLLLLNCKTSTCWPIVSAQMKEMQMLYPKYIKQKAYLSRTIQ